jgi:AcrR family transcriptional regulator
MRTRSDALRENILWAAREVFLEAGYERTSMDVVASRAKTTKRTLYAHFANKEALFLAVLKFLNGFFLGRLRTPDAYSEKPSEALVLFCGRFMETLLWEGAIRMCRVCASEAARFPEESAQFCYVLFNQVEARPAAYLRRNSELCYLLFKICLATCLSADLGPFLRETDLGNTLHNVQHKQKRCIKYLTSNSS